MRAGQPNQAEAIAGQAETAASLIPDLRRQALALATLAETRPQAERAYPLIQQAEAVARSIEDLRERANALAAAAEALARMEQPDQAATIARTITDPGEPARAWPQPRRPWHGEAEAAMRQPLPGQ